MNTNRTSSNVQLSLTFGLHVFEITLVEWVLHDSVGERYLFVMSLTVGQQFRMDYGRPWMTTWLSSPLLKLPYSGDMVTSASRNSSLGYVLITKVRLYLCISNVMFKPLMVVICGATVRFGQHVFIQGEFITLQTFIGVTTKTLVFGVNVWPTNQSLFD